MSKSKVEINESALNQLFRDAVLSHPEAEYSITCPHCGESIIAYLGDNTCEYCGGSIFLSPDPPSDQE